MRPHQNNTPDDVREVGVLNYQPAARKTRKITLRPIHQEAHQAVSATARVTTQAAAPTASIITAHCDLCEESASGSAADLKAAGWGLYGECEFCRICEASV